MILVVIVTQIIIRFLYWGLYSSVTEGEITRTPGAIDIILGGTAWFFLVDMGIPFPANILIVTVNAVCIIMVLFLVYINIRDWVWGL